MSSDAPHRTIPVKRRNGKLQSCEPCRKRKLSCDHRLPSCGRCVRRGTSDACYYHPAPLTKAASSALMTPSHSDVSSPQDNRDAVEHIPIPSTATIPAVRGDTQQGIEQRLYGILSVPSAGILMESLAPKVGFLGLSSSSAVVAELNSTLGIRHEEEDNSLPQSPCMSEASAKSGAQVLSFFQQLPKIQEVFDRHFGPDVSRTLFRPIYVIWLDGITAFVNKMFADQRPDKLERHCLAVWRNTQRMMRSHGTMSASEWAHQATGEHLRWETLGLILATIGVTCAQLPSWDPIFRSPNGAWQKTKLTRRTMELARNCIDLSKRCGSRNDLFGCLVYEHLCLALHVLGDTPTVVWTYLSELCDTMTLSGLHLEQRVDAQTPFFLYELRLRLFNYVFSMDKFAATYLGRPPHLSYRYSVIQDMSDLTDDEICGDADQLHAALSRLANNNGWSTSVAPHRATWRKAWVKRHLVREDILEVVIGPHLTDIDAQISQIRIKEKEALDAMPSFCHLNPEELLTTIKRDPSCLMPGREISWRPFDVQCFISIHGSIQHSDFLLERARVNKLKADPTQLFASARRLLGLVLKAQGLKEFLRDFQDAFTESLTFYGLPPAGVLAMEMLRRDQLNDPYDNFPRSETLQQLSVFVTALEGVGPEEGNYSICSTGLNAIRKVLDRLLSRPRVPTGFDSSMNVLGDGQFGANIGNDADFLQWLGSVDFDATTWLDSTPQVFSENSEFSLHAASV